MSENGRMTIRDVQISKSGDLGTAWARIYVRADDRARVGARLTVQGLPGIWTIDAVIRDLSAAPVRYVKTTTGQVTQRTRRRKKP